MEDLSRLFVRWIKLKNVYQNYSIEKIVSDLKEILDFDLFSFDLNNIQSDIQNKIAFINSSELHDIKSSQPFMDLNIRYGNGIPSALIGDRHYKQFLELLKKDNFNSKDFELINQHAGNKGSKVDSFYNELISVYNKLENLADFICSTTNKFTSNIRKAPLNQGQNYEEYHWCSIYPIPFMHFLHKKFAHIIYVNGDGINYHVNGIGSYLNSPNAKSFSKDTHKQIEISNSRTFLELGIEMSEEISRNNYLLEKLAKNMELTGILSLLNYKKQIILQGPPGTGKTRQAKLIAKEILGVSDVKELDAHSQFEIVQFHPSYSYEDFVEGMKPDLVNEKLTYIVKPGILKRMAQKAMAAYLSVSEKEQYENSFDQLFTEFVSTLNNKDDENPTIFTTKSGVEIFLHSASEQVINVIYRYSNREKSGAGTHIFKLSKQKFQQLLDKQINPANITSLRSAIKPTTKFHQSEYYAVYKELYSFIQSKSIELDTITSEEDDYATICEAYLALDDKDKNKEVENYILVIDEINRANLSTVLGELIYALEYRGSKVSSIYGEEDGNALTLPPNLYIIGTMNTADRSVGHIDYAIRRRFAFVDVLPKNLVSDNEIEFNNELFEQVTKLIETHQTHEFPLKDIQLGHSYFIQKKSKDENDREVLTPEDLNLRLEYEIKPILQEYVKDGILRKEAENAINNLSIEV